MNDPRNRQQPHAPSQPGPPPGDSTSMLNDLATRYWAEMDGESRIIAEFFKMMADVAAVRRRFLEENGHLLRALAEPPIAPPGYNPELPNPSPRIPNGVDHDEQHGAQQLARRMAPNGQGRR